MKYSRYFALLPYIVLFFFLGYTFYMGVFNAPFLGYYTIDESYVADGGVFLYYGMTPRCLDWPAAPSVLLFYLLFTISTIWDLLSHVGSYAKVIDVLNQIDWNTYSYLVNREPYIIAGRTLQLLLVLIIMVITLRFLLRPDREHGVKSLGFILSIVIVSSYVVWFNAPFLRPEALSGTLFLYILIRLLWVESLTRREVYILSVLFAMVIAQRLLFAFLFPVFLSGVFFHSPPMFRVRRSLTAVGIVVVFFMVLCPFFMTTPFVVGKAFIGGILAKMNDKPMETFFNEVYISSYFDHFVNYIVGALVMVGVVAFLRRKKVLHVIIVLNWVLFLFLVLRSPKIYDTHVLPASVITLIMLAYGLNFLRIRLGYSGHILVIILMSAFVVENGYRYVNFQKVSHELTNEVEFFSWLSSNVDENVSMLVPSGVDQWLPKGKKILPREIEDMKNKGKMIRKLNYLLGRKGDNQIAADSLPIVAWSNVFEDEKIYELQYELLLKYTHDREKAYNYKVYMDNVELVSNGITVKQAMQDFKSGKYDLLVAETTLSYFGKPIATFSGKRGRAFYVYRYQKKQEL